MTTIATIGRLRPLFGALLLLLSCAVTALEEKATPADPVAAAQSRLNSLIEDVRKLGPALSNEDLERYQDDLAAVRAAANACIENTQKDVDRLSEQLAVLAPGGADTQPDEPNIPPIEATAEEGTLSITGADDGSVALRWTYDDGVVVEDSAANTSIASESSALIIGNGSNDEGPETILAAIDCFG